MNTKRTNYVRSGLLLVAMAAIFVAFQWLTAAGLGEACGGATGCESGLVCVEDRLNLSRRRCRTRCAAEADCATPQQCVQLGTSKTRACLGPGDVTAY